MDNSSFQLRQSRYNLMKIIEILFNKKTEDRINSKVPYARLVDEMENYVSVTLNNQTSVILSVTQTNSFGDYILGHSLNVCMLSILIGDFLELEYPALVELGISSLLHDIGKRNTPKEIIFKTETLTEEEIAIIHKHPEDGVGFMERIYPGASDQIKEGILTHHEKMNGKGYPKGIKDIPQFGLIISIADMYEAYVSARVYHEKRTILEGIEFIRETEGLDKRIINTFIENTVFFPSGSYVLLSDETVAKVQGDATGDTPNIVIPGKDIPITGEKVIDIISPPLPKSVKLEKNNSKV